MVASAGAIAVAAGPLIGGAVTTLFSWRWVFVGEVVVCMAILVVLRKVHDTPTSKQPPIDVVGAIMSIIGLSLVVLGVLKSAEWGWVQPKPEAPALFGVSLTTWFILGGFFVLWLFTQWEARMERLGKEPLLRMELLHVPQLSGGLFMFFFQFLVQASTFFIVPLYLTVVLGLTAFATGVRLVPLSLALLTVAIAVPKFRPQANPRRVVRLGLLALAAGALVMVAGIDPGADASVVTIPMILLGCGMGALASQLGAVTVSAVPDERSAEVGGVQNTATNLGASLGTALIGSILIGSLTVAFISNIQNNPAVPPEVSAQASTQLASGIPFVSEADLTVALNSAGVPDEQATAIVQEYNDASLDALRTSMAFVALFAIVALFFSERIPNKAIGVSEAAAASPS
jgi:Na+/melibiose symporter-like transporter